MTRDFLGAAPQYDDSNFIADTAVVLGDVTLGEGASVWYHATVRGDVHWIRLGAATNVQDGAVVHVTHGTAPTEVGAYVTIAHGAIVHGCHIEDEVLVGMGAVVMDHAHVGTQSIVGARALVTARTKIPPRSLVLGSPATVVRSLTDEEVASIRPYANHYLRYAALHAGRETPPENPFYTPGAPRRVRG